MDFSEKVSKHPVIYAATCFWAGIGVILALYGAASSNFDLKIIRSDDYVKVAEVGKSYVLRDSYDELKEDFESLKRQNSELDKKNSELETSSKKDIPSKSVSTQNRSIERGISCSGVTSQINELRSQKEEMDRNIDRLVNSGCHSRVTADGNQVVSCSNDREVAEKRRLSDNINASIVSMVSQLSSCRD